MAYEPHNWGCAEVITNRKLNHIEQGIAENANGYECQDAETVILAQQNITTTDDGAAYVGAFSSVLNIHAGDRLLVTLNGVTYSCGVYLFDGKYCCGSIGLETFPFFIQGPSLDGTSTTCVLITPSAGTYAVVVESVLPSAEITDPCFCEATNECGNKMKIIQAIGTGTCNGDPYYEFNLTFADIFVGMQDGTIFWTLDRTTESYVMVIGFKPFMTSYEGGSVVYGVDAYVLYPANLTINKITLYSDSQTNNLRSTNCWGLQ